MPSDAKKRAQQKKKEQASNRNKKTVARVTAEENGSATNGTGSIDRELTAEGYNNNVYSILLNIRWFWVC